MSGPNFSVLHTTSSGLGKALQFYRMQRIYVLYLEPGEQAKVRVTVVIEGAGNSQSTYRAEVWTELGWKEIVTFYAEDYAGQLTNSYSRDDAPGKQDSLNLVAAALLAAAAAVLS
jgi:hypothetical protein